MFKAYGLYTHIRANRLRSAFLLAGFVVLLFALMFSFALIVEAVNSPQGAPFEWIAARAFKDVERGWPIGVAAAGAWFAIAYLFHQKMIDFATGAHALSRAESPRLYNLLENLCISRGVPIPALQIIESDALNAYASGLKEGQYKVAVTRGLLLELTDPEIEAVLAHELTHIRNRDVQMMVIAVIFAGIFAFVADLVIRRWDFPFGFSPYRPPERENNRRENGAGLAIIVALLIIALSWGASVLIRFALSRSREYLADAGSAELTKNPDAMISALRKIEAHSVIVEMPSRMHAFFIESPARVPESGWFATHPSVNERVRALIDYAGGHDIGPVAPPQPIADESAPPEPLAPPDGSQASFLPQDGRTPLDPPKPGPWG
ncbi:M48 family metallopeptidase [Methylocystis parvus]|uniref:M48 family metallopeptidase n=1 Tax=Methylocystis parvus TaxID=134 RepID=A0A6B8LX26_9HYPH|nr:M48 family metallopeptidase [Methylocystis parvus]QGM96967.1 M48 family metallopeptidase [Methylocystis parvus]WBJ99145.1 M48 family metallopeptidase [Methylocystis parvus OBBP]